MNTDDRAISHFHGISDKWLPFFKKVEDQMFTVPSGNALECIACFSDFFWKRLKKSAKMLLFHEQGSL